MVKCRVWKTKTLALKLVRSTTAKEQMNPTFTPAMNLKVDLGAPGRRELPKNVPTIQSYPVL